MPMASQLSFASPTASDVGAIVLLVTSAYRGERARAGWTNESALLAGQRTDAAMIADALSTGHSTILLMRTQDGDDVVGCVSLEPANEPATWHLSMLTVDPHHQAG